MALVTFGLKTTTGTGQGGNGFGNFRAGNHYWDKLGRQREATGCNGFGKFQAGNHYWDKLRRQREVMALITFGLGTTTGTRSGSNGRQSALVTFGLGTTTGTSSGGNGK